MNLDNVLFIDTESDPDIKKPESLQYLLGGDKGIIEDFNTDNYFLIKSLWDKADAVIMFNAPYDMGVCSIMFTDNSYKWLESESRGSYWQMELFKHNYNVRKLGFHRNLIKTLRQTKTTKSGKRVKSGRANSTPIIDLLKLWSILIDDGRKTGNLRLKTLIKVILGKETIEYSKEAARTEEYRYQDVIRLRELAEWFFNHVSNIDDLIDFGFDEWGDIKTPATFTKLSYERSYDIFQNNNPHQFMQDRIKNYPTLSYALESAFNGGITLSFYRGTLHNTGWVDISGAYVHAIEYLNTDSYIISEIEDRRDIDNWDYKKPNCLCFVETNFIIKSVNKSLKLFSVKEPERIWLWYNDIIACSLLYPNFEYRLIRGYEFTPKYPVTESLPQVWSRMKDEEKKHNGKTTLYDFFKFKGNTSYGINAQRKPFTTKFTNMIIAGMITSTVHMILATINNTIENCPIDGVYKVLYNDTDSCCFLHAPDFNEYDMQDLIDLINVRIYPYKVESEGIAKTTTFLSLKRYISEGGTEADKIKLHGKGRYNVYQEDIYNYIKYKKLPDKELQVTQLAANTQRGMNQILKLYPFLDEYKHPFMFVTNVKTDRTMDDFFHSWYYHIDTKTTFKLHGEFLREFRQFRNMSHAMDFYSNYYDDSEPDDMNNHYREYDKELEQDF